MGSKHVLVLIQTSIFGIRTAHIFNLLFLIESDTAKTHLLLFFWPLFLTMDRGIKILIEKNKKTANKCSSVLKTRGIHTGTSLPHEMLVHWNSILPNEAILGGFSSSNDSQSLPTLNPEDKVHFGGRRDDEIISDDVNKESQVDTNETMITRTRFDLLKLCYQ